MIIQQLQIKHDFDKVHDKNTILTDNEKDKKKVDNLFKSFIYFLVKRKILREKKERKKKP